MRLQPGQDRSYGAVVIAPKAVSGGHRTGRQQFGVPPVRRESTQNACGQDESVGGPRLGGDRDVLHPHRYSILGKLDHAPELGHSQPHRQVGDECRFPRCQFRTPGKIVQEIRAERDRYPIQQPPVPRMLEHLEEDRPRLPLRDPADRRARLVRPTERGIRLGQAMNVKVHELEDLWSHEFSNRQWQAFRLVLRGLGG